MKAILIAFTFIGMLLLTSATKKAEKPNLVFIFSDQQTFDMLGCYGNKQIKTPNLDNLASQGAQHFPSQLWLFFIPAAFISVTMLAFNLFGDGLRDALDPKLRK